MSLFRVTTKRQVLSNGVRVEKGMSVEVVTNSIQQPKQNKKSPMPSSKNMVSTLIKQACFPQCQSIWIFRRLVEHNYAIP